MFQTTTRHMSGVIITSRFPSSAKKTAKSLSNHYSNMHLLYQEFLNRFQKRCEFHGGDVAKARKEAGIQVWDSATKLHSLLTQYIDVIEPGVKHRYWMNELTHWWRYSKDPEVMESWRELWEYVAGRQMRIGFHDDGKKIFKYGYWSICILPPSLFFI